MNEVKRKREGKSRWQGGKVRRNGAVVDNASVFTKGHLLGLSCRDGVLLRCQTENMARENGMIRTRIREDGVGRGEGELIVASEKASP